MAYSIDLNCKVGGWLIPVSSNSQSPRETNECIMRKGPFLGISFSCILVSSRTYSSAFLQKSSIWVC